MKSLLKFKASFASILLSAVVGIGSLIGVGTVGTVGTIALGVAASTLVASDADAAQFTYDVTYDDILKGNYNLSAGQRKCLLVSSAYSPNRATHTRRSDVTNEITGTGYTAGGQNCTVAVTLDTTNHRSVLTITIPAWTSSTITAFAVVIYNSRGGAASADELVYYGDFGSNVSSTASTFQVTPSGPIYITHGS